MVSFSRHDWPMMVCCKGGNMEIGEETWEMEESNLLITPLYIISDFTDSSPSRPVRRFLLTPPYPIMSRSLSGSNS
ncbi:unnamed protein product [Hydatigera taeniaeformis]|uniref:Ovule protein n=1 Tax=Hydatigena taeniaeformis TaxID=6205 RepID=A0A0R3X767_HYDTA|nr:unnamed protein product [Hydatigera taeniaeformis]